MTRAKDVVSVEQAPPKHWVGDGFPVSSLFSYDSAPELDPFLLMDHAAPSEFEPSLEPRGVAEHPHRGFETVTIAYQGEIEHRDSAGHSGRIGPGDVQWMTAAGGIVHEEMHSKAFTKTGGTLEMVQLWVNLPASHKMSAPAYQDLVDGRIPRIQLADDAGSVRVIAGAHDGERGPARTHTPIELWDVRLAAGRKAQLRVHDGQSTGLLFLRGGGRVNGSRNVDEGGFVVLGRDGEGITIEAAEDATILLLSGAPIGEPVVGMGPFVMNTEKEIRQAITDYRAGKMGHL